MRHQSWATLALWGVAYIFALASCGPAAEVPPPAASPAPSRTAPPRKAQTHPPPTPVLTSTLAPSATPTLPVVGPGYVAGYNPLTGLRLRDPAGLRRPPLLVSITNFPPSARPQAGLSLAAHVWETSIGEGLSRFVGVYYEDYLAAFESLAAEAGGDPGDEFVIGPVRSGRVAFELIRRLYPGGVLVTRSASPEVIPELFNRRTVYAEDPEDVNSAGLYLGDLPGLTKLGANPADYSSLVFAPRPPAGGASGERLTIIYNLYTHVGWTYDPGSRSYLRFQDRADGTGELFPAIDRLTGEQLRFQNVAVLFAEHRFENLPGTILTIELGFRRGYGFLFRDGRRYDVVWSTLDDDLQLLDEDGRPVPLKPGRSFFEVVSLTSTWDETEGLIRFHSPPLPTLTPTPTPLPTGTATPAP